MRVQGTHLSFELLSALVDRELEPADERRARAHLDGCAACSAELARVAGVARILEALPAADCSAAAEPISAHADREASSPDAALAVGHLRGCDACRADMEAWSALDVSLRALPAALPSPRTDDAIATIVAIARRGMRRSRLARNGPVALRAAFAVVTAVLLTLAGPFEREVDIQDGGQSRVSVEAPLLAGIQYAVLNPRTNTLYLAQPALGKVAALDATTRAPVASIDVGGRPTALALDDATNTILVMDASQKTVTAIDGARNTVGATTTLAVEGTPTAINVDAANGKIVVSGAALASAAPRGDGRPTTSPSPRGFVAVLDAGTKRLETQRPVEAAPRAVVLNAAGTRALLVSVDATTLVDAATYRAIDRLPGGVTAAFSATGDAIAILSDRGADARLSFLSADDPVGADLGGRAVALIALPDGVFAALVDVGAGKGRIVVVGPDARISATLDVALAGRDLIYDPAARRFSVAGESVAIASRPADAANAAPAPVTTGTSAPASPSQQPSTGLVASGSPAATASPQPSASGAPGARSSSSPESSPAASPSASPRASPPSASTAQAGLLGDAPWAWADTYRVALPDGRRPVVVGGGGARLWFVDQNNALTSIDTASGSVVTFELPADARIKWVLAGPSFVHAIDTAGSRIFSLDLARERTSQFILGLVSTAVAATVSTDDRLWLASSEATQLVSFDPRTRALDAVDVRTHRVSALFGDAGGGVWYAEESRDAVGHVEADGRIVETLVPRRGLATGLAGDGAGHAWLGTDGGEVISLADGQVVSSLDAGGPVTAVALQAGHTGWYVASSGQGARYGPAGASAAMTTAPSPLASLAFDQSGRGWSTDGISAAFFVTTGQISAP